MKIQFLKTIAAKTELYKPGAVEEMGDAQARQYIEAGYAIPFEAEVPVNEFAASHPGPGPEPTEKKVESGPDQNKEEPATRQVKARRSKKQ